MKTKDITVHRGRTLTHRILPRLYRSLLSFTKLHGAGTLGRLHYRFHHSPYRVQLPNGAELTIPHDPHYFGFLCGLHEPHITEFLMEFVQPGDICIDVGANIGYFSMMMAKSVSSSGVVHSLEPVPETYSDLLLNAEAAREDGLQVNTYNVALSDSSGQIGLHKHIHSTQSQVKRVTNELAESSDNVVRCQTLDDFILENKITGSIKLLKIDVEGHEVEVIRGAIKTLRSKQIKDVIVEVTEGANAHGIHDLLHDCAEQIRVWNGHAWKIGPIKDIQFRTDILIHF